MKERSEDLPSTFSDLLCSTWAPKPCPEIRKHPSVAASQNIMWLSLVQASQIQQLSNPRTGLSRSMVLVQRARSTIKSGASCWFVGELSFTSIFLSQWFCNQPFKNGIHEVAPILGLLIFLTFYLSVNNIWLTFVLRSSSEMHGKETKKGTRLTDDSKSIQVLPMMSCLVARKNVRHNLCLCTSKDIGSISCKGVLHRASSSQNAAQLLWYKSCQERIWYEINCRSTWCGGCHSKCCTQTRLALVIIGFDLVVHTMWEASFSCPLGGFVVLWKSSSGKTESAWIACVSSLPKSLCCSRLWVCYDQVSTKVLLTDIESGADRASRKRVEAGHGVALQSAYGGSSVIVFAKKQPSWAFGLCPKR